MTEPKTDLISQEMEWARKNFAKHEITKSSEGRWLVRQPETSTFWFEVVVLAGGHLIVHGDIQAVIFGRYSSGDAQQTVNWMAQRERPDDSYFVEKAKIGGTSHETIWSSDDEVLREEIQELIREVSQDEIDDVGDVDCRCKERREALEEALGAVGYVSLEQTQTAICDAFDGDWERIPTGQRISANMVYAHAALQCLARLLDAPSKQVGTS